MLFEECGFRTEGWLLVPLVIVETFRLWESSQSYLQGDSFMRLIMHLLLLAVALFGLATLGCAVTEEEAEQAEIDIADRPIDVRVTATRLMEDYENNTVAANQQYNGKVLAVSGTVEAVSGGTEGDALYVELRTGDLSFISVRCYFSPSRIDEVIAINKGDRVSLRGLGDEEKDRDPFSIEVIGCSRIEN